MCGLVGAVAQRDILPILIEGLQSLEYRGYDSAGIAVVNGTLRVQKSVGNVDALKNSLTAELAGCTIGIGHTRWATHGDPSELNAHPHVSGNEIAIVHNGIIENDATLRRRLEQAGYQFVSQTDTEVIAHLVHQKLQNHMSLLSAVQSARRELHGSYAIAAVWSKDPHTLVVARHGSPLAIGYGHKEYFVASDPAALLPHTQRFAFLCDGDVAELRQNQIIVMDATGAMVSRPVEDLNLVSAAVSKSGFRHFMLKEIYEQPHAAAETLRGRLSDGQVDASGLGFKDTSFLPHIEEVHLAACGSSLHAAQVSAHWLESIAGIPCRVELASEYRYRNPAVHRSTLFITLSQSGETADTLAALQYAKGKNYLACLTICNVTTSSLVRESDIALMTRAGPEIGVASTKAFTAQMLVLFLLMILIARHKGLSSVKEADLLQQLFGLYGCINEVFRLESRIEELASQLAKRNHALFIGRGPMYPIAMEGALKLKEISYIHAEAYAAGELKHGPLALVDRNMPVIVLAPSDRYLDKMKSNIREVSARNGRIIVLTDMASGIVHERSVEVLMLPNTSTAGMNAGILAPFSYAVALQLLAYHVACIKGNNVDRPRNLAKSVTVE